MIAPESPSKTAKNRKAVVAIVGSVLAIGTLRFAAVRASYAVF